MTNLNIKQSIFNKLRKTIFFYHQYLFIDHVWGEKLKDNHIYEMHLIKTIQIAA